MSFDIKDCEFSSSRSIPKSCKYCIKLPTDTFPNSYKFRKSSMMHKTDAAIQLIRNALTVGIKADYVLMDTWFTTEPMLKNILDIGIHAIGMVKQLKQRYTYNGRQYTLPGLKKFVDFSGAGNIFGSLIITTKTGIPVKIVFVRNRNKKVNAFSRHQNPS